MITYYDKMLTYDNKMINYDDRMITYDYKIIINDDISKEIMRNQTAFLAIFTLKLLDHFINIYKFVF